MGILSVGHRKTKLDLSMFVCFVLVCVVVCACVRACVRVCVCVVVVVVILVLFVNSSCCCCCCCCLAGIFSTHWMKNLSQKDSSFKS